MRALCSHLSKWGVIAALLSSCTSATGRYALVEQRLAAHDPVGASHAIQQHEKEYRKEDRLLYLLDHGLTLSLAGQFEQSNRLLDQAVQTAEALYTESVSRHAVALLTNDYFLPYAGEDYERVMIHLFSALNFAQMGQWEEALVECRRMDTKLNAINDRYEGAEQGYQEDAFARYLSGVFYEATGEMNDAFISYRKAYEIYLRWEKIYQTPVPQMLGRDLLRTSAALGLAEEHEQYKATFPDINEVPRDEKSSGEILVVSLHGKSPHKVDKFIDLVVGDDLFMSVIQTAEWQSYVGSGAAPVSPWGQLIRIAFPGYIIEKSNVISIDVGLDGQKNSSHYSALMLDVSAIAKRALSDRINRIRLKATTRSVFKALLVHQTTKKVTAQSGELGGLILGKIAEAAASMTEVADKRSWRTLPDEIYLTRISVPPGEYQVAPQFIGQQGKIIDTPPGRRITIRSGERHLWVIRTVH